MAYNLQHDRPDVFPSDVCVIIRNSYNSDEDISGVFLALSFGRAQEMTAEHLVKVRRNSLQRQIKT